MTTDLKEPSISALSPDTIISDTRIPVSSQDVRNLSSRPDSSEGGVVGMTVGVIVLMVTTVLFSSIVASLVAILVARVTAGGHKVIQVHVQDNVQYKYFYALNESFLS